jgi:hypothetical protein
MSRRIAVITAMALAGAVLAVVGAAAALNLLGDGVFGPGGKPLSQADVQRALAQPAPATSSGQPGSAPATSRRHSQGPAPSPASSVLSSSGGTVFASCSSGQATLTSRIPAQGYQIDGFSRGPATSAWVKFKSSATELIMTVACVGGHPHLVTSVDNRGGGDHGGGGSSGGGSSGSSGH